jgi:hypothetical protein
MSADCERGGAKAGTVKRDTVKRGVWSILRAARRSALVILSISIAAMTDVACGQTRINSTPADPKTMKPPAKSDKEYSFVRGFDSDGKDSGFIAADSILPKANIYGEQLKDFPGKSVDVVMQQCHGGGFVDNVLASRDDVSFASASDWNETANGFLPLQFDQGNIILTVMEDFTRPWWQDANAAADDGMLTHFKTALSGRATPKIAQDVFAPPGKKTKDKQDNDVLLLEHPQYGSTGNAADARKLKDDNYAILVQWGQPAPKAQFEIQMARMYQALTGVGAMAADHIVVLFAGLKQGDMIGGQKLDDGVQLPKFTVSGAPTQENWQAALNGMLFGKDKQPDANSRLFIYNNGHGGLEMKRIERETGIAMGVPMTNYDVFLSGGFDVSAPVGAGTDYSLTDPDEYDSIQIAAKHSITASSVTVNGSPFSLGAPLSLGDDIRHLEGAIDPSLYGGSLVYYDLRVPHDLLGLDPQKAQIDFANLNDPNAIVAFDFAGGTQEMINVVAEPASWVLAAAALLLAGALVKQRREISVLPQRVTRGS